MKPYYGKCEMPEEKVKTGVITVCTKRNLESTNDPESSPSSPCTSEGIASFCHLLSQASVCICLYAYSLKICVYLSPSTKFCTCDL